MTPPPIWYTTQLDDVFYKPQYLFLLIFLEPTDKYECSSNIPSTEARVRTRMCKENTWPESTNSWLRGWKWICNKGWAKGAHRSLRQRVKNGVTLHFFCILCVPPHRDSVSSSTSFILSLSATKLDIKSVQGNWVNGRWIIKIKPTIRIIELLENEKIGLPCPHLNISSCNQPIYDQKYEHSITSNLIDFLLAWKEYNTFWNSASGSSWRSCLQI